MERSGRLKQKGHGCLEEQLVGISLSAQHQQWSCKTQRKSDCLVQHVSPFHSPMSVHKGGSTRLASVHSAFLMIWQAFHVKLHPVFTQLLIIYRTS